jgi:hypothetical protein
LNLRPLRPELPAGVPLLGAKHVFALWSGDDLRLVTPPLLCRLLYVVPGHLLGEGGSTARLAASTSNSSPWLSDHAGERRGRMSTSHAVFSVAVLAPIKACAA